MSDQRRFYWMKFQRDFFKSLRIRKLRRLAGGDTYTIIYLKMQLLSISNEGHLEYKGVFDSFAEEVAEEIEEEIDNVEITINYLLSCGLMEQDGNDYLLPYAAENIGSEATSTLRSRECRRRQKALQCNTDATLLQHDATETQRDCSVEREKEIEIDIDKDNKWSYGQIANMYNSSCPSFPRLTSLSEARRKAIKARMNSYSLEDFQKLFDKAESSDFLKGKNDRNWSANFDWLIKDSNMAKVLDGNYDNRQVKSTNKFNQHEQATYDFDAIEKLIQ